MADEHEVTIDEAVSILSGLEREERKKWNAVMRLRGLLSLAQSMRDVESSLQAQAREYRSMEERAKQEFEARGERLAAERSRMEQEFAQFAADLSAKKDAFEREQQEAMESLRKRHKAEISVLEGRLRALEQEREHKTKEWEQKSHELVNTHAALVAAAKSEQGALEEKLTFLRSELARIQEAMAKMLGRH